VESEKVKYTFKLSVNKTSKSFVAKLQGNSNYHTSWSYWRGFLNFYQGCCRLLVAETQQNDMIDTSVRSNTAELRWWSCCTTVNSDL